MNFCCLFFVRTLTHQIKCIYLVRLLLSYYGVWYISVVFRALYKVLEITSSLVFFHPPVFYLHNQIFLSCLPSPAESVRVKLVLVYNSHIMKEAMFATSYNWTTFGCFINFIFAISLLFRRLMLEDFVFIKNLESDMFTSFRVSCKLDLSKSSFPNCSSHFIFTNSMLPILKQIIKLLTWS